MLHSTLFLLLFAGVGVEVPGPGIAVLSAPAVAAQNPQGKRSAVPSESERIRQRAVVDSSFDFTKRMAGKDKEAIRQLAADLLQEAEQAKDRLPAEQHTLLSMGLEAAVKFGDAKLVRAAAAGLGERFFVDAATLQYDAAKEMSTNGQTGCSALDLVRLFVDAGIAVLPTSAPTANRALVQAKAQCDRCAGTKEVHDQATKEVARLAEAIKVAKITAERGNAGEGIVRVAVPPETELERTKTRGALKAAHGDLDQKSKREVLALQNAAMSEGLAIKKNGAGARFEYLVAAKDLAARCGDTAALVRAVEEIGAQFEVDQPPLLLAAARDAVKRGMASAPDLMRLLHHAARQQVGRDLALAQQILKEAAVQCDRTRGSKQLHSELLAECKKVESELEVAAELARLRAAVAAKPDDRKATEQLGWFLCVRLEQWQEGLPLLAKGETLQLQLGTFANGVAKKELAATVTDDMAWEIAEAWWNYAEANESRAEDRPALRRHAREWYGKLKHLEDVRRRKVAACLRDDTAPAGSGDAAPVPKEEPAPAATPTPPKAPPDTKDEPAADAVDKALRWLAKHQDADGRWDCANFMKHDIAGERCHGSGNSTNDVGSSGLALMAFHGRGHSAVAGEYADVVRRGLDWLGKQQRPNGVFGLLAKHDFIYGHAIATIAMARHAKESPDLALRERAQAGLGYLLQHRNQFSVWRYQERDNDNDLSVTTWCLAACLAGKQLGLEIDRQVFDCVATYLDQVSDPTGVHGYSKQGEPSARKPGDHAMRFPPEKGAAMTAAGLHCRHLLEQSRSSLMANAAALIASKAPSRDPAALDYYFWYYGTIALRKFGGEPWSKWQRSLRDVVFKTQRRDGNFAGSWDPDDCWGDDGGRIVATALLCLALEVGFLDGGR